MKRSTPGYGIGGVVAVLVIAAFAARGDDPVRPIETPPENSIRVMTWNVNWGVPGPNQALKVIEKAQADIVCLQETNSAWEKLLRARFAKRYPFMEFRQCTSAAGGLAYLSRFTGKETAVVPTVTGWFDQWIMSFDTPLGEVQIGNVHLQPSATDRGQITLTSCLTAAGRRLAETRRFQEKLLPDLPTLVAGDYNENDDDTSVQLLRRAGMTDALSQFDRSTKTWHWSLGSLNLSARFDHILYSGLHCYSAEVIKGGASDHWPVVAVFGREEKEQNEE